MFEHETRTFKRTFAVLVENETGVLARIAGLFSARGFNIISLTVGETVDPTMSRMTIVVQGTGVILEQVNKQLNKLIPVISVLSMRDEEMVVEELILIKLESDPEIQSFVKKSTDEGKSIVLLDNGKDHTIVRVVANRAEEAGILKSLERFKIVEICRTGEVALSKERMFGFLSKKSETY